MTKFVYAFTEGNKDMKDLLGGKGANLAEMCRIGLPVPPGFTITCQTCVEYDEAGNNWPDGALDEIEVNVAPVLLGGGAPLLPRRIESDRLRLVNAARHGQFVTLRYELTRPSTSGTD